MKDYYKILGVDNQVSSSEIKRAFRKKALLIHPDKSTSDSKDAFIELFESYKVLSNKSNRERYDKLYSLHFTTNSTDLNFSDEILQISQMGHVYASDYKKFDKEILKWIIFDLVFDRKNTLFASISAIFFGVWTLVKGIVILQWDYALVGVFLTMIGVILGKLHITKLQKELS